MHKRTQAPIIKKYEELFNAAIVHTRGVKPLDLLETRRPSEPDDIKAYRLNVFEPITKADFQRAITDSKKAIFTDKARFDASEELTEYINGLKFSGKSFLGWVRDIVVPRMFEDANGVIVWWPSNAGNPTELLELAPILLLSKDLEFKNSNAIKWKVGDNKEGQPVYLQVDRVGFWQIDGVGKHEQFTLIYEHQLGFVPAIMDLGGIASQDLSGLQYFESFFCSAFAWGNKAIRQDSDLEGAKTVTAYPIREVQEEPCINPSCTNGFIYNAEINEKQSCNSCGGKGYYIPSGPMAYIVKRKSNSTIGEDTDNRPALAYISPPVEGLEFLSKDFDAVYSKMQKALNQFKPDLMQSGIAKKIDLESKDASIDEVAANVWHNIILRSIEIIIALRYWQTPGKESVSLRLPDTFRAKSEQDLLTEMQAAKESGERIAITNAAKDLLLRKYGSQPNTVKMVEVLEVYDPFFGMNYNEKMDIATAGMSDIFGFNDADFIRSGKGFNEILRLSKEPQFMDMGINDIIKELDSRLNLG